jgi:hypothetical protein
MISVFSLFRLYRRKPFQNHWLVSKSHTILDVHENKMRKPCPSHRVSEMLLGLLVVAKC